MCVGVIVGIGVWAPAAWAQGGPPPLQLDVTVSRTGPAPVPLPSPEVVQQDADEAIARIKAGQTEAEVIQQAIRPPDRWPGSRNDVVTGIQQRNIQDALRRR